MAALSISGPVKPHPFTLSAQSIPYQSSGDTEDHVLGTQEANVPRSLLLKGSLLPPGLDPYSPFASTYHSLIASVLAGEGPELSIPDREYDDMKRALDTSSLPVNPMNGVHPQIDLGPSFEERNTGIPAKKTRYTPNSTATANVTMAYDPEEVPYQPFPNYAQNNALPQSPINGGGPLTTGLMQTPMQGAGLGHGINALNIPHTPFMNILNSGGMGMMAYGMSPYPMMSPLGMGFPTSPIMSPSMDPNTMTGNYGPAAAAAAAAAAGNLQGRTVYVGCLAPEASVDELLNLVRFGPIESVRLVPQRFCVFISFLDGSTAAAFHADASVKRLALHGQQLRIGWGAPSFLDERIALEVAVNAATRNVFLGNLPESIDEQDLRKDLSKYGPIDQIKIVRDKNIGFVHFLSISTAIRVVARLPLQHGWRDRRVSYGKDRCAYVPKAQQPAVQAAQAQAAAAVAARHAQMPGTPFTPFSPVGSQLRAFATPGPNFGSPMFSPLNYSNAATAYGDPANVGNRNIYIGNMHPETTTEELCNAIRGGMLYQVKHIHEKNIAFVEFVDPGAAFGFFQFATSTHLTLNTRRLKIGWGNHSGPLGPSIGYAVDHGASRNVYIGGIEDWDLFSEKKLREDFSAFGDIEMINFLKQKGAAFINFCSIAAAQTAIQVIQDPENFEKKPEYESLRISYGKDRCANAPKPPGHRPSSMGPRVNVDRTPSGSSVKLPLRDEPMDEVAVPEDRPEELVTREDSSNEQT